MVDGGRTVHAGGEACGHHHSNNSQLDGQLCSRTGFSLHSCKFF